MFASSLLYSMRQHVALLALLCGFCNAAFAQPLEDISMQQVGGKAVVSINLSGPVHYLRNAPSQNGQLLEIFYERLPEASPAEPWRDNETLKSPPTPLLPGFTVTTSGQSVQPKLVVVFARPVDYSVSPGRDGRSFLLIFNVDPGNASPGVALPQLPDVLPLAMPPADAAGAVQGQDVNKQAAELMANARSQLAASDNSAAVETLNRLLLLPPNDYTQDAQEWVGVARERTGQTDKARVEYELYLTVYGTGPGVARVKTRLTRMSGSAQASVTAERGAAKPVASQRIAYGSVSMHYFNGVTQIDSAVPFNNAISQTSQTLTDQSALLSTVDATERFISEDYDNRLVFRDANYQNFVDNQPSKNRVNSAYFEIKNRKEDYSGRFGRQSSSGAGVMGRFDGAALGYGLTPGLRLNAVAGQLADLGLGSAPIFYGASVDTGPLTLYAINQTVDGVADRRALGSEFRYFEEGRTAFALLDYDTIYSTVNIALLQGTLGGSSETSYNFLFDHRKAPYIATKNALNGASTTALRDLLQIMTEKQLQALAQDRTATSNLAQVGVTHQVAEKWQAGSDIRVSSFSSMPASGSTALEGILPGAPGSGNEWAVTPQLIGSNLYSLQDITVFSLSLIKGDVSSGESFFVYSRAVPVEKWMLDASMQLYRMNFQTTNADMTRVMPMLRVSYQVKDRLSLDAEGGLEISHISDPNQSTDNKRQFYSLGFRWDF